MKTRLARISPGGLGLIFAFFGFVASFPIIIIAVSTIGPGRTVTLGGFVKLTFTGSLEPVSLLLTYPLLNALAGMVGGFLLAWLYNFYARVARGVSIDLEQR
jgi:hypothetical protein